MSTLRTWIRRTCTSATIAALCGGLLAPSVFAYQQDYRFTYSKLYTQLKNNLEEGHDSAQLGVFFVSVENGLPCPLSKAWMEKEEKYETLEASPSHELLLPLDSHLRQANPLVFVEIDQPIQCDFSMVVMSKESMTGEVGYEQLTILQADMQQLLGELGGMFSRWFTPNVEGVTLEFALSSGEINISNGQSVPIVNHRASIDLRNFSPTDSLNIPESTLRVMPYIPSAN
ncbi:DUF2987 domain-containing protein [Vibrio sp. FNV 38]|nr:DUF2987 domain-containing protein [Vibrio sp. FNV 38]